MRESENNKKGFIRNAFKEYFTQRHMKELI